MHEQKQKVHFIAIGGSVMHNLAVSLKLGGHEVTGSDDEIHEPSRSTLKHHSLLPDNEGWNADKITKNLDAVILGMHARKDNPELLRAQELGLKIYSFPQYIYENARNKQRVVIAGSHGKTTITANLAGYLATELGKRVLLIDLDHQRSLTQLLREAMIREPRTSEQVVASLRRLASVGAFLARWPEPAFS